MSLSYSDYILMDAIPAPIMAPAAKMPTIVSPVVTTCNAPSRIIHVMSRSATAVRQMLEFEIFDPARASPTDALARCRKMYKAN